MANVRHHSTTPSGPLNPNTHLLFVLEGKEYPMEKKYLENSSYLNELQEDFPQNQLIKVTLPKWVNATIFNIFVDFLKDKSLQSKTEKSTFSSQTMQRLLWLGDFFQMDAFQDRVISDFIIPSLDLGNCLLFLNESFKKLKACEDSNDMWYMLLNQSMNFTSKNIVLLNRKQSPELFKVNAKILEEIIERYLRYTKDFLNGNEPLEVVEMLMKLKGMEDPYELLNLIRKNILGKKINYENHSSISWKLSNIESMINKETNTFKLNGYYWKLLARIEDEMQGVPIKTPNDEHKFLRIYLRLDKEVSAGDLKSNDGLRVTESNHDNSVHSLLNFSKNSFANTEEPPTNGILSLYYQIKANGKEIYSGVTMKTIFLDKNPKLLLCEFSGKDLSSYSQKKIEFTVYLNADYMYSAVLTYIARNLSNFYKKNSIKLLNEQDVSTILKCIKHDNPNPPFEQALIFCSRYALGSSIPSKDVLELFKLFEWKQIKFNSIFKILSIKKFHGFEEVKKYLESELTKKIREFKAKRNFNPSSIDKNVEEYFPDDHKSDISAKVDFEVISGYLGSQMEEENNKFKKSLPNQPSLALNDENSQPGPKNLKQQNFFANKKKEMLEASTPMSNDLPSNKLDKIKKQNLNMSSEKLNLSQASLFSKKPLIENSINLPSPVNQSFVNSNSRIMNKINNSSINGEREFRMKMILDEINIKRFIKPMGNHLMKEFEDFRG